MNIDIRIFITFFLRNAPEELNINVSENFFWYSSENNFRLFSGNSFRNTFERKKIKVSWIFDRYQFQNSFGNSFINLLGKLLGISLDNFFRNKSRISIWSFFAWLLRNSLAISRIITGGFLVDIVRGIPQWKNCL